MYIVYLFKEKSTDEIIYVGSSSRPCKRMNEHHMQLEGRKKPANIHKYMSSKGLEFYKDVEVIWCDYADDQNSMYKLEETYYFKHLATIKNEHPGQDVAGKYNPRRRRVKCINDGQTFETVSECAVFYQKGRTTISNVLIKEKPYTFINGEKYFFEYINE